MREPRSVVLLGGTSGIGRALARKLAERGDRIVLFGRKPEELERSVQDLRVRGASKAAWVECDLRKPESFASSFDEAQKVLGFFDTVIVTAARFATQEQLERDRELLYELLTVNFTHTVLFCEEAKNRLLARGGGTLCVLSSVAGERGRKPVVFYGATKAGLSRYLEGLDHRFRQEGLRVITIKPGFVKTPMTAGLKPPPFAAEADEVAELILFAIDWGIPVLYVPLVWAPIMSVIRRLPRFVMRRFNF
ncbi:MAG: SDR family NAD(P)-dependent oxidoreductase [Sandaracinaceae bacterium]|nr:SDR family NAD(P)-dependent oxidoreductase [Sandaracinaceae bacterium]MDW8246904.1 SDR family NAD(P)-dependent oxidoreductase [Sandaracinaceae bacterium]